VRHHIKVPAFESSYIRENVKVHCDGIEKDIKNISLEFNPDKNSLEFDFQLLYIVYWKRGFVDGLYASYGCVVTVNCKGLTIMSTSNVPNSRQPKRTKFLSSWLAYPLALIVWEGMPWAISLLMPRYGWTQGRPGFWNLLGLIPILVGTAGLIWGVAVHSAQSPQGIEWELDKSYLLRRGLYTFSRNPMYLSELVLLLGWVLFYGSIAVLIAFVVWYAFFNFYIVPLEERTLEAHFGEAYREYKQQVPRWFGKIGW
jgi:protein-S-isoprenylcysteine O-methyltransferase Ste14